MAHVAAAIYRQGARNGGDFHRIPTRDERDVSPVLDLIELERRVAIPCHQEGLPKLADSGNALYRWAVRRQDDGVGRIGAKDCFNVTPLKGARRLGQTDANLCFDALVFGKQGPHCRRWSHASSFMIHAKETQQPDSLGLLLPYPAFEVVAVRAGRIALRASPQAKTAYLRIGPSEIHGLPVTRAGDARRTVPLYLSVFRG